MSIMFLTCNFVFSYKLAQVFSQCLSPDIGCVYLLSMFVGYGLPGIYFWSSLKSNLHILRIALHDWSYMCQRNMCPWPRTTVQICLPHIHSVMVRLPRHRVQVQTCTQNFTVYDMCPNKDTPFRNDLLLLSSATWSTIFSVAVPTPFPP